MDRTYIQLNLHNTITIGIMGMLFYAAVALMTTGLFKMTGRSMINGAN